MKKTFYLLCVITIFMVMCVPAMAAEKWLQGYRKVLVIGAHPDDPESMSGGLMVKLRQMGAEVVSVYLTCGEAGIPGLSHEEARQIRRVEAENAAHIIGARPLFMTQVDGNTYINKDAYKEMLTIIEREKPDAVFTHWPIDSHRDHRVCSILVYDAWRQSGHSFDLYYGEVMTGLQTQNFTPTRWVDITEQRDQKIQAYLCHKSQNLEDAVSHFHNTMEVLRGMECQASYGEAYIQQVWSEEK